ncbi:4-hydroxy-tetrahydrodipicolinate reductase [Buchnera aphidicola (Mollitrichosiphum nigrofasciatum)]|uniref:4-hydroxy-tetrahydrodipicolinate reductase n=1 Tax=Buchnera aphidicola TaxID=9 RepID=UPI0031B806FA
MKNKKIRIGISGAIGRMGKILIKNIHKQKNLILSVLLVKKKKENIIKKIKNLLSEKLHKNILISDSINNVNQYFDVLIDFSTPKNTIKNLKNCIKNNKKIVIGTTGFNKIEEEKIKNSKNKINILKSANFSIGINVILDALKKITQKIGNLSDIDILEKHHIKKKDLPSGTALSISKIIKKNINTKKNISKNKNKKKEKKISFATIRAGNIIGEHTIFYTMESEILKLSHIAMNRNTFAIGALIASEWLYYKKTPGLYNMNDVLKKNLK